MKLGKASYGGGNKKTYFKLKDGDNTYRILPPMGDLADQGIWSVFYRVHYGYKNSAGKLRPFESPLVKNYKTKMIEAPDAALERIENLKAQLEAAKKANNQPMITKLNEFVGQKGMFNLDSNHYLNVIDLQGNIGILKLRHRAKVALDAEIKRLREKGVDPLSVENGRFFTIRRSGMGLDTTFQVSVMTRTMNIKDVGDVQQEVPHTLDASIISRLSSEAAVLDKLFKKPTSEEVARIVAQGATAVDEILDGKGQTDSGSSGGEDYDDSGDYEDNSGAQSASAAPTTTQATTTAPAATAQQATAPTATLTAQTVATVPTPATVPTTTATQVTEMNDADFLKSLGL